MIIIKKINKNLFGEFFIFRNYENEYIIIFYIVKWRLDCEKKR